VATPLVLAVRVEGRGVVYRGLVVTQEATGAEAIAQALRDAPDEAARAQVGRAAGRAVGVLHAAGIRHADLNLTNLLLQRSAGGLEAVVLDLDRARVARAPLSRGARRRALRRLARSYRKLLAPGTRDAVVLDAFRVAYEEASGSSCAC
jgi:3-deoxy-D-manno-octulosonic acid kinase